VVRNIIQKIYNNIPYQIRTRPFDFTVPLFLIILVMAHWFKWIPPTSFFFQEAAYDWLVILCEVDLLIGSIIVVCAMIANSFKHRCVGRVSKLELVGWWTIFAGSLSLSIAALAFTPDLGWGWPTLVWLVNALAALVKVMSPLEDRIKWTKL
jgi:hypothetical protein